MKLITAAFDDYINKKKIKKYTEQANAINISIGKDDVNITEKINKMKNAAQTNNNVEALHCCAEIIHFSLGIKPFTSQLIATLALLDGKFVEMDTGEGKTLVFLMASAINALKGRRIVLATANEYLAQRDAEFAMPFLSLLNIELGIIKHDSANEDKVKAYSSPIVYCDLSDVILDYLRASFSNSGSAVPNISLDMILIDEADHVLIDKASIPLSISKFKPTDHNALSLACESAFQLNVKQHIKKDADEKSYAYYDAVFFETNNDLVLQDGAFKKYENNLIEANVIQAPHDLYKSENLHLITLLEQAIKGIHAFEEGKDYIVAEGAVIPINRHTGRTKAGQHYSSGLQQVIELKEGLPVSDESYPFTSISIQHFIQLYNDVVGMSGTLLEDKDELKKCVGAEIIKVARNKPLKRVDEGDYVYLTEKAKRGRLLREVVEAHKTQQPILICASSEKESLSISKQLSNLMINHNIIMNKNQREEASIIQQAGLPNAITITSGMSGRGTDIVLGGLPSSFDSKESFLKSKNIVINAGGLLVIQSGKQRLAKQERQTIGRAGRQGDPGRTMTLVSMEDDLLKPFNLNRLKEFMISSGAKVDLPINNNIVNKSLKRAQQLSLEGDYKNRHFIATKMAEIEKQRKLIFDMRSQWLNAEGDAFSVYVHDAFNVNIRQNDIEETKKEVLRIFDENYLNYRIKTIELMNNMGLRSMTVSNIGTEIKQTMFKTFGLFIDAFQTDAIAYLQEHHNGNPHKS